MTATAVRSCPGCRSQSAKAAGTVHGFEVAACSGCGTLFTAQLPQVDKDYGGFYAEGRNLAVPEFVLGRLEETVGSLAPYRTSLNRWLDIGCGTGEHVLALAARMPAATLQGVDVSPANIAIAEAARRGHAASGRISWRCGKRPAA